MSCSCGQSPRRSVSSNWTAFSTCGCTVSRSFVSTSSWKSLLPLLPAPNQPPGLEEREAVFEKFRSVLRTIAAGLLDAAQETRHLPQRLFLARLQESRDAGEMLFVAQDNIETAAHFVCHFIEQQAGGFPGRLQLQDVRAGLASPCG